MYVRFREARGFVESLEMSELHLRGMGNGGLGALQLLQSYSRLRKATYDFAVRCGLIAHALNRVGEHRWVELADVIQLEQIGE